MTWILFALAWSVGGLWFAFTCAADYVAARTDDEIPTFVFIALLVASGPLVWAALVALAVWGEE